MPFLILWSQGSIAWSLQNDWLPSSWILNPDPQAMNPDFNVNKQSKQYIPRPGQHFHIIFYWAWLFNRLLTNQGPDRSGSCLILIRQSPDFDLACAWLIRQLPEFDQAAAWSIRLLPDFDLACAWSIRQLPDYDQAAAWSISLPPDFDLACAWSIRQPPEFRQPDIRQCLILKFGLFLQLNL